MKKNKYRGQMLAEVVIAIGLLAIILVGMSELMTRSTLSTRLNKEKDEASRAVEARLSFFRQEIERDPGGFYDTVEAGFGLEFVDCGVNPWPITAQYDFACTQKFSLVSSNIVLAEVKASWTYKTANDMSVTLSSILSF